MHGELKWPDVERMFGPEPMVAWDRDVAPRGWMPVFRIRSIPVTTDNPSSQWVTKEGPVELWADDADCLEHMRRFGQKACRCVAWFDGRWIGRFEREEIARAEEAKRKRERQIARVNEDIASGRVYVPRDEWSRDFLGEWADDA